MASGKSFIGKKLANLIDFDFLDLDDFIEMNEKMTVKKVFSEKGEIYFRKTENKALLSVLNSDKNMIVGLGGGTPCYFGNMDNIVNSKDSVAIYLKTPLKVLAERLKDEKDKRPLISHLNTQEDLIEFIGKHLFERSHFYNQAQVKIDANREAKYILEDIVLQLF